jgi:hypothetical protein
MRRPIRANTGAAPFCTQTNPKQASTANPIPTSTGTASPERGARASNMPRPMQVKAICARNSAVTSTTVDAVAVCHSTPCSVTARAPNTNPPTWENGRQLADESRTMRPQMSTHARRIVRDGMIRSQARPRITNSTICQPTIRQNFGHPTRLTEETTVPKP